MSSRGRTIRVLAWAAVVLAVAYFSWRGVWRGATTSGDLAVGFSAAHAWLVGHNPYDVAVLNNVLLSTGGGDLANSGLLETLRNVYFPATLPVFLPLALLTWPEARLLALAINVSASVFIALGVSRLLGWPLTSSKSLVLTAFLLALAPVQTTIAFGQTGLVSAAAVVAAMLLERAGRATASGLLYGFATVVKIQVGLPFVAYLVWRRRWAPALASGSVLAGLTALSVARMQLAGVPWVSDWLANLSLLSSPGQINDPSLLNPDRYSLINLQYPLSALIANRALVELLTFGAVGVAALAFIWLHRDRDERPDLLALALVAVLGLLVAYHRYYDAVLLALPIGWACSVMGTPRWQQGVLVLGLCADFILPWQTAIAAVQDRFLPASLTGGVFWNAIVLAQHAWALVLIAIVLVVAAAKDRQHVRRRESGNVPVDQPDLPELARAP